MITLLLQLAVVLLAFPAGYLIAWLARDELIAGRRWLLALSYVCSLGALFYFMLFGANEENFAAGVTIIFIGIMAYIGYMKSLDKKWTKKRRV